MRRRKNGGQAGQQRNPQGYQMANQSDDNRAPAEEQPENTEQEQSHPEQYSINRIRNRASKCVQKEYVGILLGSCICLSLMVVFVIALVLVTAYVKDINEDWGYYLVFSTVGAIFGGCISLIWNSFHDDFR